MSRYGLVALFAFLLNPTSALAAVEVEAAVETPARIGEFEGNNNDPDDPAIWTNSKDLSKSLVISTLKEGGMDVYNLDGVLVQHIEPIPVPGVAENPGRFNNVDIVFGVELDDDEVDLAVASDRHNDILRVYSISEDRLSEGKPPLQEVTAEGQKAIFNNNPAEVAEGDFTSYGLAVSQLNDDDEAFVFVSANDRNTLAMLELDVKDDGRVGFEVLAKHDLPEVFILPNGDEWFPGHDDDDEFAHVEGIVVDDENGSVYFGQEKVGLWKADLESPFTTLELIDTIDQFGVPFTRTFDPEEGEFIIELLWDQDPDFGSDYLVGDLEGLTIYKDQSGEGYLLASSQGSNEYAVYSRTDDKHIDNFKIVSSANTDSAEETDGIAVSNLNFGGKFSTGLLVVQDGDNSPSLFDENGDAIDNANFKLVPWGNIANPMDLSINNVTSNDEDEGDDEEDEEDDEEDDEEEEE